MPGSRTRLITRSDDGYFGLKQSLSGAFTEPVSSLFYAIEDTPGWPKRTSGGYSNLTFDKTLFGSI